MEKETTLLVAQGLLILGLTGLLIGWDRWRQRRDRRAGVTPPPTGSVVSVPAVKLTPMPPVPPNRLPDRDARDARLVPEELLLPGFADTCPDWGRQVVQLQVQVPVQDKAGHPRFSLSDWSAP